MKQTRYLNFILTLLTLVMALNLVVEFSSGPSWSTTAQAQEKKNPSQVPALPDSGAQREEIIKQLRELNKKMDAMVKSMTSGEMKVRIASGSPPSQ